jgi:hypothetical protein
MPFMIEIAINLYHPVSGLLRSPFEARHPFLQHLLEAQHPQLQVPQFRAILLGMWLITTCNWVLILSQLRQK